MLTDMYKRQSGILHPDVSGNAHITICGCGTVGSNAAVQLAKLGVGSFHLWDPDIVEEHNIPSQDYGYCDLYEDKTTSLRSRLKDAGRPNVYGKTRNENIPGVKVQESWELEGNEAFSPGIVLLAVDSMDMRRTIFSTSVRTDPLIDFCIDFRMGGPNLQVWSFDPRDGESVAKYEDTLYSSEEAVPMPCGTRTFAPVGALSGAIAAQLVTAHLNDRGRLPFYTQMDLANFEIMTAGGRKDEDND